METPSWVGLTGVCAFPATASVGDSGRPASQDARGHGLVPPGPAPAGAHGPVEQGQLERPGRRALGQDRQVTGGDPAVPRPEHRVIGKRLPGQEGRHRGRQVIGPFQGQAREPERLHQPTDQQRILPDAVHLAQQQQAGLVQGPPGRAGGRGLGLQLQVGHLELGCRPEKCLHRINARHPFSMALVGLAPARPRRPRDGRAGPVP
jgi:hypothetical protein